MHMATGHPSLQRCHLPLAMWAPVTSARPGHHLTQGLPTPSPAVLGIMALPESERVAHLDGIHELPSPEAAVAAIMRDREIHGGGWAAPPVAGVTGAVFVERTRRVSRRHLETNGERNSARGLEAGAAVIATDLTLGVLGKQCDMHGGG